MFEAERRVPLKCVVRSCCIFILYYILHFSPYYYCFPLCRSLLFSYLSFFCLTVYSLYLFTLLYCKLLFIYTWIRLFTCLVYIENNIRNA